MHGNVYVILINYKPSLRSGDLKRLGSVWFSRFVDQNNRQVKYTHSTTHNVDTIKLHMMFKYLFSFINIYTTVVGDNTNTRRLSVSILINRKLLNSMTTQIN